MKISLCIICKNEEKYISHCINSVKAVVDEIVVVDTGSEDETITIAKQQGAIVFETLWEKDFAKARNYALDKATGEWIVFLDADEYFTNESIQNIRAAIIEAEKKNKECLICEMINEDSTGIRSILKTIRIFKSSSEIRYKGKIHERILNNGKELSSLDVEKKITIIHTGYAQEVIIEKNKIQRNIELLLEELEEDPTNSVVCYYLMQSYNQKEDIQKMWEYGMKALEYDNFTMRDAKIGTYERIIRACLLGEKSLEIAHKFYCDAVKLDEFYPDFDFRYGEYLYHMQHYGECVKYLELSIEKSEAYRGSTISSVEGKRLAILEMLGTSYLKQDKYEDVVPVLVKILYIDPYRLDSLYNLINILIKTETAESIGAFLGKLYDYNNLKNQMLLLQLSSKMNQIDLYNYILQFADERVKKQLHIK